MSETLIFTDTFDYPRDDYITNPRQNAPYIADQTYLSYWSLQISTYRHCLFAGDTSSPRYCIYTGADGLSDVKQTISIYFQGDTGTYWYNTSGWFCEVGFIGRFDSNTGYRYEVQASGVGTQILKMGVEGTTVLASSPVMGQGAPEFSCEDSDIEFKTGNGVVLTAVDSEINGDQWGIHASYEESMDDYNVYQITPSGPTPTYIIMKQAPPM